MYESTKIEIMKSGYNNGIFLVVETSQRNFCIEDLKGLSTLGWNIKCDGNKDTHTLILTSKTCKGIFAKRKLRSIVKSWSKNLTGFNQITNASLIA